MTDEIETVHEAEERARKRIDGDAIIREAIGKSSNENEAKQLAKRKTETEIRAVLEKIAEPHLVEHVIEELTWEMGKEARSKYVRKNLEEYV